MNTVETQSTSSGLAVEPVASATPAVRTLIEELDGELAQNYCCEQRHGLDLTGLFQPHVHFFIARLDGEPVGCGGVALLPEFAEVKRMYVQPQARGRGVAEAIMSRLTEVAVAAGLNVLRLETGTKQTAALRFYERCGFTHCVAFEPYASMPADAVQESVFLEKRLG